MLCTLIKQMGTPNDAAIRDAEEKITQAAVASPSGFINSLLEILSSRFLPLIQATRSTVSS